MKKILGIFLLIEIVVFHLLSKQTGWVENFYVPYIFKPISYFLRITTAPFPFSVGLVLVYFVGFTLAFYFLKSIINIYKKQLSFKQFLINILAVAAPLYLYYMLTWGLLYYRMPIAEKLGYGSRPIELEELKSLCSVLVQETNLARKQLNDSEIEETSPQSIIKVASQSFEKVPHLKYPNTNIKLATGSKFIAYFGTGGIYTFWSGEANVNQIHPNHDLPEVCLHEMAHQTGFASEDEANYIAWLAGKNHPNKLFKYSAHYNVVWRSLARLWAADSTYANALYKQIDSTVYQDFEIAQARWKPYRNLFREFIVIPFYSLFLKANGQEEGINSYDAVVDLIIFERRKQSAGSPEDF